jgi:Uma2 family endonuclease
MKVAESLIDIEYPESDGKPMGETDLHRYWMNRVYDLLSRRYRGQRVYVGCDLLVYYTEGRVFDVCVPDVFVAIGAQPGFRRTFKTWEEGLPPTVVVEVTSRGTRREDEVFKPQTYSLIGVKEYFLYDPTADYLSPPLMGHRLVGENRGPIAADAGGALLSRELGIRLWLDRDGLILADATTGELLLTDAEAADVRAQAAEDEARRLRAELEKYRPRNGA